MASILGQGIKIPGAMQCDRQINKILKKEEVTACWRRNSWALELQMPELKPRLCHLTSVQPQTFTGPPHASLSSSVEWELTSWGLEEDSVRLHARPSSQSEHRVSAGCGLPSELERSTVPAVLALRARKWEAAKA